jgi:acyl dehydratase
MTVDETPLLDRLRAMIGAQNAPDVARDAVNPAMIRHWCDAMEDANPVYTDPELAAKSIHGGLVAPPAMLNAWTMPGLPGRKGSDPSMSPMRALDEAGFSSVIATNSEHEYLRVTCARATSCTGRASWWTCRRRSRPRSGSGTS